MKHKIGIITVCVNCLEYTKQTLNSINTSHDYQIIVVNNGSSDGTEGFLNSREDIISYQNPKVSGLSACWNLAIDRAIKEGCDLMLVVNNDIVLAKNTIDNMVKRFEKGTYVMVTGSNDQSISPEEMINFEKPYEEDQDNFHPDFSCFLIENKFIEKIGFFDENFMVAYFEDSDAHARIALAGEIAISTVAGTYWHYASKTIQENPKMAQLIHDAFRHNREYFENKWGHSNVGDVPEMLKVYWKHPFNDPNRDIKNIEPFFVVGESW